jgi:hypothetical protein
MDPHPDPDPLLVRGMDPRIRIHNKMSWIRNTGKNGHKVLKVKKRFYDGAQILLEKVLSQKNKIKTFKLMYI